MSTLAEKIAARSGGAAASGDKPAAAVSSGVPGGLETALDAYTDAYARKDKAGMARAFRAAVKLAADSEE